jgi:hypothetical protein
MAWGSRVHGTGRRARRRSYSRSRSGRFGPTPATVNAGRRNPQIMSYISDFLTAIQLGHDFGAIDFSRLYNHRPEPDS